MNEAGIKHWVDRGTKDFQDKYRNVDATPITSDRYIERPLNAPESGEFPVYHKEQEWQFQIRLAPNQQNLQWAESVLSEALKEYNVPYKLLRLVGKTPTPGYDPVQDYNTDFAKNPRPDLDRMHKHPHYQHRVGHEFCVRLAYSHTQERYQYTPEQYKEIMLKCIKALQDNQVEFGSLIAPIGAKNIPCDEGIPPLISYSLTAPPAVPDTRHNILPPSEQNLDADSDHPLGGVKITKKDLERHNIDLDSLQEDGRRRTTNQERHFQDAVQDIKAELEDIWNYKKAMAVINPQAADVPLVPESEHCPFLKSEELGNRLPQKRQNEYSQFIEYETKKTVQDFENFPFAIAFLKRHLPRSPGSNNNQDLHISIMKLVKHDLKKMQILYLRLVHLQHEQESLRNTLIFLGEKLPQIFASMDVCLRKWQQNNKSLRDAFDRVKTELAKLPNTDNIRKDIIEYINSALPQDKRLNNPLLKSSHSIENFESEKERKAALRSKLLTLAQKLDGKGPAWSKVLGAIMILSGILLGGLCLLTLIPSLGLSALPGVTLSTSMILGGASFFAATAVAGGVVCYVSRDQGASKAMQDLACAV